MAERLKEERALKIRQQMQDKERKLYEQTLENERKLNEKRKIKFDKDQYRDLIIKDTEQRRQNSLFQKEKESNIRSMKALEQLRKIESDKMDQRNSEQSQKLRRLNINQQRLKAIEDKKLVDFERKLTIQDLVYSKTKGRNGYGGYNSALNIRNRTTNVTEDLSAYDSNQSVYVHTPQPHFKLMKNLQTKNLQQVEAAKKFQLDQMMDREFQRDVKLKEIDRMKKLQMNRLQQ